MTENEAKRLVAVIVAAYPGRQFDDLTARLYIQRLMRHPQAEGEAAVLRCIESERLPPSLGILLEYLKAAARPRLDREAAEQRARELPSAPTPMPEDVRARIREWVDDHSLEAPARVKPEVPEECPGCGETVDERSWAYHRWGQCLKDLRREEKAMGEEVQG